MAKRATATAGRNHAHDEEEKISGPQALFRGKVRAPVSITLTPAHHAKVKKNMRRVGLSRSDFIGLLIEKYGDTVNY